MKAHVRNFGLIALICLLIFGTGTLQAQDVTDPSTDPVYDSIKAAQTNADLGAFNLNNRDAPVSDQWTPLNSPAAESSCFIPVDGSYTAVPRNDDGSYGPISLPFAFNLYGTDYTQVWINTNGNISFTGAVWAYSSTGFPFGTAMVAPFWGDVDTRNTGGGQIYYKMNSTNLIVTWNGVGYYGYRIDKLNTFQAIIGTNDDALTGIGQNVSLRYADMQWTTGDASGGSYGFGGVPATVGINKGNYVNYVQIGRFNQNNSNYDGPGGNHDGVHYLDHQCVAFNVSNAENIPPSFTGLPSNNTINLPCGQTANYTITAIAPEVNQSVSVSVNTGGLCNTIASVNGSTVSLSITGASCNSGTHTISLTATDNGVPAETTIQTITVIVEDCCIPPTIFCDGDIIVDNDPGLCGAYVDFPIPIFEGTPTPVIDFSHEPGSFFPVGTTTVNCYASNECGTASCSFNVTVRDNEVPVFATFHPRTAQEIIDEFPGTPDGEYTLYLGGDLSKPFKAYCYDMAGTPREYLTLEHTGGSTNRSQYLAGGAVHGTTVNTNWTKVRFDPLSLTVNISDFLFSTSTGNINGEVEIPFGLAKDCYAYWSTNGQANVNFVGTSFAVNDTWTIEGYLANGSSTFSNNNQVVDIRGGGWCGHNRPTGVGWEFCLDLEYFGPTYGNTLPTSLSDITQSTDPGSCGAIISWPDPNVSDNCGFVISSTHNSGDFFPVGTTTVTYTATDDSGNSSTSSFQVTVIDDVPPVVLTQDIIVDLDESGNASIAPEQVDNGSDDNCEIALLELNKSTFTCDDLNTVVKFDGINDYAQSNNNVIPASGDFTVSVWAKHNSAQSYYREILSQLGPNHFYIGTSPSGILRVSDQWQNTGVIFPTDDVWHHYAVVKTSDNTYLYIDGDLKAARGAAIANPVSNEFRIGTQYWTHPEFFDGYIDEITIWNTSKNAIEIEALMSVPPIGSETDLLAYYDMEGLPGDNNIVDITGNGNDCHFVNMDVNSAWIMDEQHNPVILTATDIYGNSASATVNVTLIDNILPTALAQDVTVQLDESGTASVTAEQIDDGSADNCGIASLSVTPNTFGCEAINYGLDFDGSNDIIQISDNPELRLTGDMTLEAWFYVDAFQGDWVRIVGKGDAYYRNYGLWYHPTGYWLFQQYGYGGVRQLNYSAPVPTNSWHYIGAVVNNDVLTLYVDGIAVGSTTVMMTPYTTAHPLQIGFGNIHTFHNGTIDEVRLWNVARTPEEIIANWNKSLVGDELGLLAYYTMEEGPGSNLVTDVSGNGHDGSLVNMDPNSDWVGGSPILTLNANSVVPVTLTVTDINGNVNTANAEVTVVDNIDPVAITQDITVQLNAAGNVSVNAAQIDNGSYDNCAISSLLMQDAITDFVVNGGFDDATGWTPIGNAIPGWIEWKASGGNPGGYYIINDVGSPGFDPGLQQTLSGLTIGDTYTITGDFRNHYNCCGAYIGQISFGVDIDGAEIAALENPGTAWSPFSVTFTATNTSHTLKFRSEINGTDTDMAIDNIAVISLTSAAPSMVFNCDDVGPNEVDLIVTDMSGNTSSASATITVEDNVAPIVLTQNLTIGLDDSGAATITAEQIDNGSSDNCAIESMSVEPATFDCSHINGNTDDTHQAYQTSSAYGNQAYWGELAMDFTVLQPILISELGAFDHASDGIFGLQAGGVRVAIFDRTTQTIVPGLDVIISGAGDPLVANHRMREIATVVLDPGYYRIVAKGYHGGELNGNSQNTVTSVDDGGGAIQFTGGGYYGPYTYYGFYYPTIVDGGPVNRYMAGTFSFTNVNLVTLTVTDVNGNIGTATAGVIVEDNIAPVAMAQDLTVQLDASGNATITAEDIDNGSSDACGISSLALDRTYFNCEDIANNPHTVILTVTDNNGNSSTATADVTIEDLVPPEVLVQNIIVQLDATGNASISANDVDAGSSDACGIATLTLDISAFTCDDVGENTVTLTAIDVNGNISQETAVVTVVDDIDPTVLTNDVTIYLDENGQTSVSVSMIDNGSFDNCGIASLTLDVTDFTCEEVGENTVTLIATDVNGNLAEETAIVTVLDEIDPTVITQDVTIYLDEYGQASITVAMIDNDSFDNCGIASLTLDKTDFTCEDVGDNTVTLTTVDVNGNVSQETAIVTVLDQIDPTVITQDATIYLDEYGQATINVLMIDNGSFDNCAIASLALDVTDFSCDDVGENTVTLTAIDVNGNVSQETAVVNVVDDIDPTVITQDVTIYLDEYGHASITVPMINNGSFDNCGIEDLALDKLNFICDDAGENTVTLTATDVNGNVNSATAIVTVLDEIAPTITLIAQPIVLWPPNHKYKYFSIDDFIVSITDNCTSSGFDPYISKVSSDEPENANGNGDGNTYNDMVISDDGQGVDLRAERSGRLNGRVYTIYINATDEFGNVGEATCKVTVPKSNNKPAVEDDPVYWVYFGLKYSITADSDLIESNSLEQNIPNPFDESTRIDFNLVETSNIDLSVYNVNGQKIQTLASGITPAGTHSVKWKGINEHNNSVHGGVYLYVLKVNNEIHYKKMILMK